MIKFRLEIARTYLNDARMLFEKKRFNSAASRAYYASYQAMWAALGEPEEGKVWRHLGIIKHFVAGYWFGPAPKRTGPGLLEDKRLPLRRLYSYRIRSDYQASAVDKNQLWDLLETVQQVIQLITEKAEVKKCRK